MEQSSTTGICILAALAAGPLWAGPDANQAEFFEILEGIADSGAGKPHVELVGDHPRANRVSRGDIVVHQIGENFFFSF